MSKKNRYLVYHRDSNYATLMADILPVDRLAAEWGIVKIFDIESNKEYVYDRVEEVGHWKDILVFTPGVDRPAYIEL